MRQQSRQNRGGHSKKGRVLSFCNTWVKTWGPQIQRLYCTSLVYLDVSKLPLSVEENSACTCSVPFTHIILCMKLHVFGSYFSMQPRSLVKHYSISNSLDSVSIPQTDLPRLSAAVQHKVKDGIRTTWGQGEEKDPSQLKECQN